MYDIPVVLLMFRRPDGVKKILDVLREIKPKQIFALSDGGRNEDEWRSVNECRNLIDECIDWECDVKKRFLEKNQGVYGNIALGAKWVFENTDSAIFLEDDNIPEITFFRYCKEMLEKYKDDPKVLWICGTNYMGKMPEGKNHSYYFTQHLLPCGWASWSKKFLKYYDFKLDHYNANEEPTLREKYLSKALFEQQFDGVRREIVRKNNNERFHSWDYHMLYTILHYDLYGIAPCNNQIRNIGIDAVSEHGFTKADKHTMNLCGMKSYPLEFPLEGPSTAACDGLFNKLITKKILLPLDKRIKAFLIKAIRKYF